jgi:hypothetical protein
MKRHACLPIRVDERRHRKGAYVALDNLVRRTLIVRRISHVVAFDEYILVIPAHTHTR